MPLIDMLLKLFIVGGFFLIVVSRLTGKTIGELISWINNMFQPKEDEE